LSTSLSTLRATPGLLDLERELAPAALHDAVHLPDRCRRHGLEIEALEALLPALAVLRPSTRRSCVSGIE